MNRPKEFFEIFAGGSIVGLSVAHENLADHITLVELDNQVASVWSVILGGDAEKLATRIIEFNLNKKNVDHELNKQAENSLDLAFKTILKNRVNRGGILAEGAGKVKHGENGKGLKSRWYPETLYKRIMNINKMRDRISFQHSDGIKVFEHHSGRDDACFFIDPPYTAGSKKAGRRLYDLSEIDHELLFDIAKNSRSSFLMTYDNDKDVVELAERNGLEHVAIAMKNTHHAEMTELLISKDLAWV